MERIDELESRREDEGRQREQPEVGPLELQVWALVLLCWR